MRGHRHFLLAGSPGAGKTSLCAALLGDTGPVRKTQSLEFYGRVMVDLPGEYLVHPQWRRCLLAAAADVDALVYVQAADRAADGVPWDLFRAVPKIRLIGVISKTDAPGADTAQARKNLLRFGVETPVHEVSIYKPETVALLRSWLVEQGLFS